MKRRSNARSARNREKGSKGLVVLPPTVANEEDRSIGSALSVKDQFDILVPIKIPTRRPRYNGVDTPGDEQSDVSSITIDEHQKLLKYLYHQKIQQASLCLTTPTSWCCFPNQQQSASTYKGGRSSHKRKKETKKITAYSTTPAMSVDKTEYSLFDELSDDDVSMGPKQKEPEDALYPSDEQQNVTRLSMLRQQRQSTRNSVRRRRMPWSKKE
jgi:hypothetical protein